MSSDVAEQANEIDPLARRPWSATRKLATAGGVLALAGLIALIAGGVLLGQRYQLRQVPAGTGMAGTLRPGNVLVLATGHATVRRGDIVAVSGPLWPGAGGSRIERVIGVGGDRVSCAGAGAPLVVDGHPVRENYLDPTPGPGRRDFAATVPAGSVFLAGDDRGDPLDSRSATAGPRPGALPLAQVDGVAAGVLRGGDFTAQPDTGAFTDAGLPGPATGDAGLLPLLITALAGAGGILLGLLILAAAFLATLVRHLSSRMSTLASAR